MSGAGPFYDRPGATPRYAGPLPLDLAERDARGLGLLYRLVNDEIDAAYWTFSRCARGEPVRAELYARRVWILEALIRARQAEGPTVAPVPPPVRFDASRK